MILSQFDETLKLNELRYQQRETSGLERTRLVTERLRFWNDVQQADLDLQKARSSVLELLASPQDTQFSVSHQEEKLAYQRALAVPDVIVAAGDKRNFGVDSPVVNVQIPLPIFNRNQAGIHGAHVDLETAKGVSYETSIPDRARDIAGCLTR